MEETCFFLDNDELLSLKFKKHKIDAIHSNSKPFDHSDLDMLVDSLKPVKADEIKRKEESLLLNFKSIYGMCADQSLTINKTVDNLKNKLKCKLAQVREDMRNWLNLTCPDHEIVNQLMQQRVDLIERW